MTWWGWFCLGVAIGGLIGILGVTFTLAAVANAANKAFDVRPH